MDIKNKMSDYFKKEKYEDVIELIKEEYVILFRKMLDFKKQKYNENEDFYSLSAKIPYAYPQYSDSIMILGNTLMNTEDTYFDVMNHMLNIYDNMSNGYTSESDYSEDMWSFEE